MEGVFLRVLNMSLTAGYAVLAVLALRLLLRRAPKRYSYLLWSVVGFRFLCPFSFSSAVSLFNVLRLPDGTAAGPSMQYVPADIAMMAQPAVSVGIPAMDAAVNAVLPPASPSTSVNPMQVFLFLAAHIWLLGIVLLLLYAVFSLARLYRQVRAAVRAEDGYWECDSIGAPFVLGLLRPRIYLPFGLSEEERSYILAHERFHIRWGDHYVKFFSFLLLAVHWFNPLAWAAFALMTRDMEMRCDEHVLAQGGRGLKKSYSASLLAFAANSREMGPTPLAFGESRVKARIQNVLRYTPAAKWTAAVALALCLVLLVACAANPVGEGESSTPAPSSTPTIGAVTPPIPETSTEPINQAKKEAIDYLNRLFSKDVFVWYEGSDTEVVVARRVRVSQTRYQELFDEDWEEVDALPPTEGGCVGLGWGHDCILFHLGTEYVTMVDGETVTCYRVPSVNANILSDFSEDSIDPGYAGVFASPEDTFEAAADRWLEQYRVLCLQHTFPESDYAMTDMAVVDREVTLTREGDGGSFVFRATLAVKPPDDRQEASHWWIGNSYGGEGEWDGWILMKREFRLERVTNDNGASWTCAETGADGVSLGT